MQERLRSLTGIGSNPALSWAEIDISGDVNFD